MLRDAEAILPHVVRFHIDIFIENNSIQCVCVCIRLCVCVCVLCVCVWVLPVFGIKRVGEVCSNSRPQTLLHSTMLHGDASIPHTFSYNISEYQVVL